MFDTLRQRLILSHVLPLLIIVPLIAIGLIYLIEARVLLPMLMADLTSYGSLAAEIGARDLAVWNDSTRAEEFVENTSRFANAHIVLIDATGRILATSDPTEKTRVGMRLERPGVEDALHGRITEGSHYSTQFHSDVADVFIPVLGSNNAVRGVIRLSYGLAGLEQRFLRLRYLIAAVLAFGLLLGSGIGWLLAASMERPVRQLTEAVHRLTAGEPLAPLPGQGPVEFRILLDAFNTLVQRLHSLEDARRKLLANLVHELGRPLGALHSAIQALRLGADEDPDLRHELLDGMDNEIMRLQRLLDDLARLHEQVLGTLELNRQLTPLFDWLAHVLPPWREAAREAGLHWNVSIPIDLPALEVDSDRLAQALGNLLSNAIKYTPKNGTVSVAAGTDERNIWIHVSDTGPGLSSEDQKQIFTPFYRGSQGRRFSQGLGLGLSIAHDLVTAHGGQLDVQSEPGRGSQFTIRLPLPADHSPQSTH